MPAADVPRAEPPNHYAARMNDPRPYIDPDDDESEVCGICPSKRFPRGGFVIYDRPNREAPFDGADGYRYTADGTPACVHPHKIGLEPDRAAPARETGPPAEAESPVSPSATPQRRSRWRFSFRAR